MPEGPNGERRLQGDIEAAVDVAERKRGVEAEGLPRGRRRTLVQAWEPPREGVGLMPKQAQPGKPEED